MVIIGSPPRQSLDLCSGSSISCYCLHSCFLIWSRMFSWMTSSLAALSCDLDHVVPSGESFLVLFFELLAVICYSGYSTACTPKHRCFPSPDLFFFPFQFLLIRVAPSESLSPASLFPSAGLPYYLHFLWFLVKTVTFSILHFFSVCIFLMMRSLSTYCSLLWRLSFLEDPFFAAWAVFFLSSGKFCALAHVSIVNIAD